MSDKLWIHPPTVPPLLILFVAIAYALYILAYPPRQRAPALALFCIPVVYAFVHQLHFTPCFTVNDTLGRMLYIWAAYMSYAFLIAKYKPVVNEESGWRVRLRQAGKVLFTRQLKKKKVALSTHDLNDPHHHRIRHGFAIPHILKPLLFLSINHIVTIYTPTLSSSLAQPLPVLSASALGTRVIMTWDTCIGDMLYFDSVYSLFALIWVFVLRLDEYDEWSESLFGSLVDCWSVRRYWGVYWHDYIRESFTAHVRLVTRGLLKWEKSSAVRRLVENACVFELSGLSHALVVYVQTKGRGEVWAVTLWYSAQILPIIVEEVLKVVWRRSTVRKGLQAWLDMEAVMILERIVGYAWVLGWMLWSVPLYMRTRHVWEMGNLRRRYPDASVMFEARIE